MITKQDKSLLIKATVLQEQSYDKDEHRLVIDGVAGRAVSPWVHWDVVTSVEYLGQIYACTSKIGDVFQITRDSIHQCSYRWRPANAPAGHISQCPSILIGGYFCPKHAEEMLRRAKRSSEMKEIKEYLKTLTEEEIIAMLGDDPDLKNIASEV